MIERLRHSLAENSVAAWLALITLCVYLVTNAFGGYDYFRDEFYYIACTDHLDWGYVDHPPLSIFILWVNRMLFGDSIFALRLLPALDGAALVYVTGLIVRELRGGRVAQLLACLAAALAPIYLIINSFYSMNAFEPLFWMSAAYVIIRILHTGDQRLWLLFGAIVGFGLQNKHSMLFFGFAVVVGLLLTDQRKQLASKWFWLGGLIAIILFLPNLLWQMTHDWATLEFMRNAQQWKIAILSPWEFISFQVLFQHPLVVPLWLGGTLALFFHRDLKRYRLFGVAFIALVILFIVQRGKPYYLSPIFPVVISAGAIAFERFVNRRSWRWLSNTYVVLLIFGGLVLLPLALPVLPVETYIRYSHALRLQQTKLERHEDIEMPQPFADRFGWREMVAEVAAVYQSLPPDEKAAAAICTQNYGEAGAIDFFGGQYQLPEAICGHNSYWHWGTRGYSGEILIVVGGRAEDHRKVYDSVVQVATHRNAYAMPFENNLPIFVCRKPKLPLSDVWGKTKFYI